MASTTGDSEKTMHHDAHNSATIAEDATIASKRQAAIEAREQALQAKADAVRAKAQFKARPFEPKPRRRPAQARQSGEPCAENRGHCPAEVERKIRLDVHGTAKAVDARLDSRDCRAPLSLAAGIVLICLAHGASLKWACAVFMTASLILFTNSACYHLGDWSPRVTDVLRRIDHVNIFLLIAGTYTPVSFALEPFWRNVIIISMWACTAIAIVIHVIWINAPRWLYTVVYIIFGIYGLAYMVMFWNSPYAGPAVVVLLCAGGACYILGAIVYALRKPDPWPRVFGFHEIFHCGTVAGYACHMVAIYMVIVSLWQ